MENDRKHVKVIIAAGGTGGHLFPAQALALDLIHQREKIDILFMGAGLKDNPYFKQHHFGFQNIVSATPYKKSPWQILKAFGSLFLGIIQALKFFKRFRPDVTIGFGSFHSFPVLVAAKLRRTPIILFESNVLPGRVNRFCSRWATISAVQFEVAGDRLKGKTTPVQMPLLQPDVNVCQKEARRYFELDEKRLTFLVFGGSQGAQPINRHFCGAIERLQKRELDFQVIHIVGSAKRAEKLREVYAQYKVPACVKPFEEKMHYAWCAADLSISRAGSATLAEQIEFEIPGILIPYPYGTENHQGMNAAFLAEGVQGAVKITEAELSSEILANTIEDLLISSHEKLKKMKKALHAFKDGGERKDLCSIVFETLIPQNATSRGLPA